MVLFFPISSIFFTFSSALPESSGKRLASLRYNLSYSAIKKNLKKITNAILGNPGHQAVLVFFPFLFPKGTVLSNWSLQF